MNPHVSFEYSLQRPLPLELRVGVHNLFTRYKDYPVFSFGWWWRRTATATLLCFVAFFATTFSQWVNLSSPAAAAETAFLTFLSMWVALCLGTGLATWIRHRSAPGKWTLMRIVAAVLICGLLARFFDYWLRQICFEIMAPYPATKPMVQHLVAATETGLSYVTSYVTYTLFGGGFAILAYSAELQRWELIKKVRSEAALKVDKQQADMRLSVLQAQVEPHFLFNTLASVRALVRQDPAQSEATLDALVNYLRASIPRMRGGETKSMSTLGQQLDLCGHYLEVMRIRTAGRLGCEMRVPAELLSLSFPPMLLITLVENAVKHGIEPKRGEGVVAISASREDGRLRVSIQDNGVGLQPGVGTGLGLANVRAQLDALYAGQASFGLCSLPGGVRADIEIPVEQVMP